MKELVLEQIIIVLSSAFPMLHEMSRSDLSREGERKTKRNAAWSPSPSALNSRRVTHPHFEAVTGCLKVGISGYVKTG